MFDADAARRPGLAHAQRIAMIATIMDNLIMLGGHDGATEVGFMPRIMSSPIRPSQRR
jgi:hypothetical protein